MLKVNNHKMRRPLNAGQLALKPPLLLLLLCLTHSASLFEWAHARPAASVGLISSQRAGGPLEGSNSNSNSNSSNNKTANRLQLAIGRNGQAQIPGLYDDFAGIITPLQGQQQFNQLVLGLDADAGDNGEEVARQAHKTHDVERTASNCSLETIRAAGRGQTISLVQYYMATCPDCQGFSPYFKRFAYDIQPHWRRLVRLFTVNCNDFQNIHLCQEQNPKLIVPMVRWYALPIIQRDARQRHCNFSYRAQALSIAHRQFIDEQRRDLISLRRATLRFVALMLDELNGASTSSANASASAEANTNARKSNATTTQSVLFESLPAHWHHLEPLGRDSRGPPKLDGQIFGELTRRAERCEQQPKWPQAFNSSRNANNAPMEHFVVLENGRSFLGRTIIADWSAYSCGEAQSPGVLIHRTSDLDLLKGSALPAGAPMNLTATLDAQEPILLRFKSINQSEPQAFEVLIAAVRSNGTSAEPRHLRAKRNLRHQANRLDRIQQRVSLERFYAPLGASLDKHHLRYVASMTAAGAERRRAPHKRDVTSGGGGGAASELPLVLSAASSKRNQSATYENANWTPESAYPGEERLRYAFNKVIASSLNISTQGDAWPSALLRGRHAGKIERPPPPSNVTRVEPAQDDQALMLLTDYYKGLDEIVHIDLLAKARVDGLQLLASCKFLRDLKRHFPYQGNAFGSTRIGAKSIARYYIELVQAAWMSELRQRQLTSGQNGTQAKLNVSENLVGDKTPAPWTPPPMPTPQLDEIYIPSRRLEQIQLEIRRTHDVGLPAEKHFRWNFCAGSSSYLRGHTCSLWVLFHTLTVQEYLQAIDGERPTVAPTGFEGGLGGAPAVEYKFQIDYSKAPRRACNPASPDGAYLAAKSRDLFVNSTDFVLANIINFVRFYLPCTNCAAHFSCMVDHSPGLHFPDSPANSSLAADSHLLWLWEGHNRVNERTRGTHSEDPVRPKHIFPHFNACPQCYLEQPKANATFASMRFNRLELVKFVVARYRKSALLNNKINIEDLYKKT